MMSCLMLISWLLFMLSFFLSTYLILEQGDPWFSLWLYDNRCTTSTSMMTNHAGFDLKHIFGTALHDKIMSIVTKLMPPQSNCLPLAISVLNWLWCSNSYFVTGQWFSVVPPPPNHKRDGLSCSVPAEHHTRPSFVSC
jgi:hypothetical protein